jgi:tRNA A-37 threonylcarbamoyl transferase component Bud32
LGQYLLLEKLGQGGMGAVYKARHTRLEKIVAIKILPRDRMSDAAAVARFSREMKTVGQLHHANIVGAHDAGEADGVHFLVMEYVAGVDLSARLKQAGPLPWAETCDAIRQAAVGLQYAHEHGIVHRDIKPANLMLTQDGVVKVTDLGLARLGPEHLADEELTGSQVMGTADYMAPEQALNTHKADARADIYSLGCTLHRLVTGQALYNGQTVMEKILAHRERPIPSLRAARPEVPPALDKILARMLAKRPDDRYQTMNALVADLEALLAPKMAAAPLHRRHMAIAMAAGVFAVAGALAGVVIQLQTSDGTLTVEVNEPDARVQVLKQNDEVEITRSGGQGTLKISVDPGKHRLRVEKEGFQFFAQDFEMRARGKATITATLTPLEKQTPPAVVWSGIGAPPLAIAPFNAEQAKAYQAAWAKHLGTQVETTNSIGMTLVLIPPGVFLMGTSQSEAEAVLKIMRPNDGRPTENDVLNAIAAIAEEQPQRGATISRPFLMGATEITFGQFKRFVEATKYMTLPEKLAEGNSTSTTEVAEPAKKMYGPGVRPAMTRPVSPP